MTEQEAIKLLQNLNVKLTDMAGHKINGIEKIFGWNEITAICEAIKALEKQIAKKPIQTKDGNLACECGLVIQRGKRRNCLYYCHSCGTKIDWE